MASNHVIKGLVLGFCLSLFLTLAEACWGNATCNGPPRASFPGPWESNMYSPSSRTVSPHTILDADGNKLSTYPGPATLKQNGSLVIFDFGQEVGGISTVNFTSQGQGSIGLAFSEAKNFTGFNSDESNGGSSPDGALVFTVSSGNPLKGSYTTPLEKLRGGFRYLSVFALTNDTNFDASLYSVSVELAFQPTWPNLRAYGGYFHSSDELLNRIWYACVYTLQMNAIPPNTGRVWGPPSNTWFNNANLGPGETVVVDGAKRDRAVWAGDLGISIPAALVGLGDLESSKNALNILYLNQISSTGELPEVGPPIGFYGSDSYHMAAMIATHDYVLYSNDTDFLQSEWSNYKQAMTYMTNKIDNTGLLDVTGASGWGRSASAAGHSSIGNALMYGVLKSGSSLATWMKDQQLADQWDVLAENLKDAMNSPSFIWDPSVGAFKNSQTDGSIHPEDGNSMALYYGAANSSYATNISDYLSTNWTPFGAKAPEMPGTISPYVESFEIKGHFETGLAQRALDLIRLSWGWYLNNPAGTQSTMLEGYNVDGSFLYTANEGYDQSGSYTSHAHGWSTGPVDALISYVVGLRPVSPGGATWSLAPQTGDLDSAQGGFTTPLGKFSASWENSRGQFTMWYDVPAGTTGTVRLPWENQSEKIFVDGGQRKIGKSEYEGSFVVFDVPGGRHTIKIEY